MKWTANSIFPYLYKKCITDTLVKNLASAKLNMFYFILGRVLRFRSELNVFQDINK